VIETLENLIAVIMKKSHYRVSLKSFVSSSQTKLLLFYFDNLRN